jgi:hypothetical protein
VAIENPEAIRDRLLRKLSLERRFLIRYDDYFEGEQGLKYLAPEVRQQIGTRLVDLLINLPRYTTDVYENRLDVEGFRFPGVENGDKTSGVGLAAQRRGRPVAASAPRQPGTEPLLRSRRRG